MFDKRIKKIILKTLLSVTLLIPAFVSANYFTLPVDVNPAMDITAWFDHDNTVAKIRFDGQTDFSYDDHNGTDFYAATATPVLAPRDGEVKDVYWNNDGGWTIHVYHDDIGLSTVYAHVATTTIATTTDNILRYDQIAYVDSTGAAATGPHLHFGVVDDEELTGNRIDPFGWSGTSTDPWPYNQGYLWTTEPPSLCDEDGNITRTFFPSLDAVLYSGWSNSWSTTRNGYNVNAI